MVVSAMDPRGFRGLGIDQATLLARNIWPLPVTSFVALGEYLGGAGVQKLKNDALLTQMHLAARQGVSATKVGALADASHIDVLADAFDELKTQALPTGPVVLDPGLVDHCGSTLMEEQAVETYRYRLFPLADVLTVNAYEAELITGRGVGDVPSMKDAAKALFDMGATWPVVKGVEVERYAIEIVYDGNGFVEFGGDKLPRASGSGCMFSALITAGLAEGASALEAIDQAKSKVNAAIEAPLYTQQLRGVDALPKAKRTLLI